MLCLAVVIILVKSQLGELCLSYGVPEEIECRYGSITYRAAPYSFLPCDRELIDVDLVIFFEIPVCHIIINTLDVIAFGLFKLCYTNCFDAGIPAFLNRFDR